MHSRYAVEKINDQTDLLNSSRLSAQIEKIPPQDSFHASKRGECTSETFLDFRLHWFWVHRLIFNIKYHLFKKLTILNSSVPSVALWSCCAFWSRVRDYLQVDIWTFRCLHIWMFDYLETTFYRQTVIISSSLSFFLAQSMELQHHNIIKVWYYDQIIILSSRSQFGS